MSPNSEQKAGIAGCLACAGVLLSLLLIAASVVQLIFLGWLGAQPQPPDNLQWQVDIALALLMFSVGGMVATVLLYFRFRQRQSRASRSG